MAEYTQTQWRALVEQLTAVRDSPTETALRRAKAGRILTSVRDNPQAMRALSGTTFASEVKPQPLLEYMDFDFI
jgi:hypothetical protein